MKTAFLLLFTLISSISFQAIAQESPVSWDIQYEDTEEEGIYLLKAIATIDNGWYVYSQHINGDGPVPTSLVIEKPKGFKLVGEAEEEGDAKEGHDALFAMRIKKYATELILTQKVKVKKKKVKMEGYVEFMTCDDTKCLAPQDVPFSIVIEQTN